MTALDQVGSYQLVWAGLHVFGLLAAFALRVATSDAAQARWQAAYLCTLATLGVAALAGQQFGWSGWTASATTLAAMILVAVADSGGGAARPA